MIKKMYYGTMSTFRFKYNDVKYQFKIYNTPLGWRDLCLVRVDDNTHFKIKTRAAAGVAIKINKRCVSADGGAMGVFDFLCRCIRDNFMMCYVYKVCELFG